MSLLLALALAAAAANPLADAQSAFYSGEFESALRDLDALVEATDDPVTLSKAHVLRAQCSRALDDYAGAEAALSAALDADPELALDPGRYPAELVALADSLRQRMAGKLVVEADPENAEVRLDGKLLGTAPLEAKVPVGRHRLEVRAPGRLPAEQDVIVRSRKTHRTKVVLSAAAPPPPPEPAPVTPPKPEPKPELVQPKKPAGPPPGPGTVPPERPEREGRAERRRPRPEARVEPEPEPADEPQESPVEPFGVARAVFVPGAGGGFEAGGGASLGAGNASLSVVAGAAVGLTLRVGFGLPVSEDRWGVHASLDVPAFFVGESRHGAGGAAIGGGVSAGTSFLGLPLVEPFGEVAVRRFFTVPAAVAGVAQTDLLLIAGARFRVP